MNIEKRIKNLNISLLDLDEFNTNREPFSYLSQTLVHVGPALMSSLIEDKDSHYTYQHICESFHHTLGLFLSQLKLSIGSDWNKFIAPNSINIRTSQALAAEHFDTFNAYVTQIWDELFDGTEHSCIIEMYGVNRLPQNALISISGIFQLREE
ncbi:MAG: hypothetical protein C0432_00980 [Candidatus Puniceispirillum sp.]|nr:hypothetical protein [Candidatus Pelagibacter sp.]MBA4282856.1 hypothetical protein [Candidatus Puniceispirillum sp.]